MVVAKEAIEIIPNVRLIFATGHLSREREKILREKYLI